MSRSGPDAPSGRVIARLYALLLYCYPPSLRRQHGGEMRQFLRASLAEGAAHEVAARLVADAARSLPREWLRAIRRPRRHAAEAQPPATREPMRNLIRDARYAVRLLARTPGFTLAAITTLALGIGANTAIFTLADATLLRPIDAANPERLVAWSWTSSYPDYQDYAERRDVFAGVIAVAAGSRISVEADGVSDLRPAAFVSGNTFDVLGVGMAAGRALQPADDVPNRAIVAVLGYDYWAAAFAGRADAIGKTVRVNGRPATIVGVARKGFRGTSLFSNPAIYLPATSAIQVRTGMFQRVNILAARGFVWMNVIGRVRDGVTIAQAASAMDLLYARQHPPQAGEKPERLELTPLATRALGAGADGVRRFVLLLAGVVALTLLIGCANLANLLLVRSAGRRREVGVRMALGAARGRVIRQMLTESVILSFAGGAAGLAVALAIVKLLSAYQLPGGIDIGELHLEIDRAALAATAGLSILTGLLFGAAPAWRAARTDVMLSLGGESRSASPRSRLRSGLVAVQVALSLVLLAGSGLFLRSLVQALDVPLGFTPDGVALASVNVGLARYDSARAGAFYEQALARVRALPQVKAAAWASLVPTNGRMLMQMEVDGYRPAPDEDVTLSGAQVGPEYFAAAGTRLIGGRAFSSADTASAPPVVIVSAAAAAKYFGGRAIGRRMRTSGEGPWLTVVGVAENAVSRELGEKPVAFFYFPLAQPFRNGLTMDSAHLFARTDGDASAILPLIAEQLRAVDPAVPLFDVRTFTDAVRGLVMPQRMAVTVLGLFTVLALALAAIGIYGVAASVAALRRREIGIRIALGADRGRIRRLVLHQGAVPVAAGLAAGLGLALWSGRLATRFLYKVSPSDPLTLTAGCVLLAAVALAATYLPAHRAAGLDPMTALRHD